MFMEEMRNHQGNYEATYRLAYTGRCSSSENESQREGVVKLSCWKKMAFVSILGGS